MDPNTLEKIKRIESSASLPVQRVVREYKSILDREKSIEDSGFGAIKSAVSGTILPVINNLILSFVCRGHWLAILGIQALYILSLVVPFCLAHMKLDGLVSEAKYLKESRKYLSIMVKSLSGDFGRMLGALNVSRASLPNTGIKIYLDTLDQLGKSLSASSDITKLASNYMKMLILPFVQACIMIAMCLYLFC